ncbi:hypothetical protein GH742_03250 [Legionella sp. MW5194]|uniref:hypothetical protein n=1 Tax=Legionella sp. MW5194 TaxID=2662448 RepID=UPI00193DEAB6|nr:hypothetical protein [Legionella sp. MW5194]QRN02961.1 hypothetical protein GH742_03250 [Legionella sp. MW5194]
MPSNDVDYKKKLEQYGIQSHLIPSGLSNEQYQVLYKKLRIFNLTIKEKWQLLAILGDESAYENLEKKDMLHGNMAHYAAFSGNIERLNQVLARSPQLFWWTDVYGYSAALYAASSGNPDALQWVKDNIPHILGSSIVYSAAKTGNPAMLQWVKDNKPDWLKNERWGFEFVQGAARSGNPDALLWVNKNLRDILLAMDDKKRNDFLEEAATSDHEPQLGLALALCDNPQEVKFDLTSDKEFEERVVPALLYTLQTNYTLTRIIYPYSWSSNSKIDALLQKNKDIILELNKLSRDFTVLCQQDTGARTSPLSKGALLTLFKTAAQAISPRIPEKDILAQFNKINNNSNKLKHDGALEVKQEASRINALANKLTGIDKGRALLISEAWVELKALILEQDTFIEDDLRQWYFKYGKTINKPITPQANGFFKPEETSPYALLTRLCEAFGFDEKRVMNKPETNHSAGNAEVAAAPPC